MRALKQYRGVGMRWTGISAVLLVVLLAVLLDCRGGKEMPAASQSKPWDPFLDTVQTRTLQFFLKDGRFRRPA